jgi:ankyrin repeat protein
LSGNVELAQILVGCGAQEGFSYALSNAVSKGHVAMSRLLLETEKPDLGWRNFEGKTALEIASERNNHEMVGLLSAHGAA